MYNSLTGCTLGKPGLEGVFTHPETCSVVQMEFIANRVSAVAEREIEGMEGRGEGIREGEGEGEREVSSEGER